MNSNTDKIYILGLRLEPKRKGSLVGVSQIIDEDVYNQMKDNLSNDTKNGKLEMGVAGTNGVQFRLAFNSLSSLNHGIKNILLLAQDIIENGINYQDGTKGAPRTDLQQSYEMLNVFWEEGLEQPSNLEFLRVNIITRKAMQIPQIAKLVSTTKFELKELDPFNK